MSNATRCFWVVVLALISAAAVRAAYDPAERILVLMDLDSPRGRLLSSIGLPIQAADGIEAALPEGPPAVVVIDAAPENLRRLVEQKERLAAFTAAGGWVMLWGVAPDGLADFNRIVGVQHLLRPFEMEEVEMPLRADPLMKGVHRRDIFMQTGTWTGGVVPAPLRVDGAWTWVVDYDDIGPFCKLPGGDYWQATANEAKPGQPHCPRSMVNGLTDQWRFGFYIRFSRNEPLEWPVKFPRQEEVVGFSIMPSTLFCRINRMRLTFDDGGEPVELTLEHVQERQDFEIDARKATGMTMAIADHWDPADKQQTLGIVNLWIKVKRSEEFYKNVKPLLNIGVLVKYPMGKGGVLLNQMNVPENETNPRNATKKREIMHALLRNLGAM